MNYIKDLIIRYPQLKTCEADIKNTTDRLIEIFRREGRLYLCGNGGSAADALHWVGELGKSFLLPRSLDQKFIKRAGLDLINNLQGAVPAFALVENAALATAYGNDVNPEYIFAQQVYAYARQGDCVLGISTSGNSKNILRALETAKARGSLTIGLTGRDGGQMKVLCDECIVVSEMETYKIQELHVPIYHTISMMIEDFFWGKK